MTSAYELIEQLKSKVNAQLETEEEFEVCRGFELKSLPMPLECTYISFSLGNVTVGYVLQQEQYVRQTVTEIRINCFSPSTKKAYSTEKLAESVMSLLENHFGDNVAGYTVNGAVYDSSVRAYKVESTIRFSHND